jgi:lipoprotein-releasing system ATP-binding protein
MSDLNRPVISCQQVSRYYDDGESVIKVLQGIDLSVHAGERVAIVGNSGSGKSTFLQLLGGLDIPTEGEVFVTGQSLQKMNETQKSQLRNQSLGFVYQFHHLLPEFTALENVAMPLLIRNQDSNKALKHAKDWLAAVGLQDRLHHKPGMLSGGERQRAALARALVTTPRCVLADEPTGNLDRHNAEQVQKLISTLSKEFGVSFVVVTHDHNWAKTLDKGYELLDGTLRLLF